MAARPPSVPTITNTTLTTADTGYGITLPSNCMAFSFQARTAIDLKVGLTAASVQAGGSGYMVIKSGTVWNSPDGFASGGTTVYFSSGTNGTIVEGVTWA